jgi:iron(III) transport system substrate-binding protein
MKITTLLAAAALLAGAAGGPAGATVPEGYPASYQTVIDAAMKEGKVVVYSTTDAAQANALVKDFEAAFPGIQVEYSDLNSTELYNRLIAEAAAGQGTADVAWSSAPDLQVKLAADGYAAQYTSPEAGKLPAWANYKNTVYGVTADPITIVYNKRSTPEGDVPATHEALLKLLEAKPEAYKGKIAAYDPERSGVGFYFVTQDEIQWKGATELFKAFGKVGLKTYTSAGAMIEKVTAGEHLMAYGIFGSYAVSRNAKDPNLGIIFPKDYTLVTTRAIFVPEKAKNPNAGRLFLDYLLSKRGQTLIAGSAKLFAAREDVEGATTMKMIKAAGADTVKAIALDDKLLDGLDQTKRLRFLKDWSKAMKGQ